MRFFILAAREHRMAKKHFKDASCDHCGTNHHATVQRGLTLQQKTFVALALATAALLLGPVVLGWEPLSYTGEMAYHVLLGAWNYAAPALPWVVLGIVLGGLSMEFIPRRWFAQELGGTDAATVAKASLLGVFFDVCSHGALAIGVSLYRSGASVAATVTFLLATPWLGIVEMFLLIALLGWKATVAVIVTSIIAANIIGIVIGFIERRGWIETHSRAARGKRVNLRSDAAQRLRAFKLSMLPSRLVSSLYRGWDLFAMIGGWIVAGFIMTGLVTAFLSPEMVSALMGYASVTALPFTALVAALVEVCSEGSVPLVAALRDMGASMGAVFVFLMAGVATDIAEIGTLAEVIGKRAAVATLVVAVTVSIALGYALNFVWLALGF